MSFSVERALSIKNNFEKYSSVKSILLKGDEKVINLKYSIVIPTFKRVATLKDTLQSAINQDFNGKYNIIICDNNPERNDETELFMQGISDKRIKYYKNTENIGMTGNWNRCVELCDGEYFIMIHDDDILYPFFLKQCDKILHKHPNIKLLFPQRNMWYQSKEPLPPQPKNVTKARIYKLDYIDFLFSGIPPTGILFNKEETIRLGGFDESTYPASDLYFSIKAIKESKVYLYTMSLSIYRWSINESFKLNTLLGFIEVFTPLRIWMRQRIKFPMLIINYLNRYYTLCIYNIIKNTITDDLNNPKLSELELPKNKLEITISKIVAKLIYHLQNLKHKIHSDIV